MAMSDRLLVHEADPFIVQVDEVGQFQWPDGGFQGWEGSSQTILLAYRTRTMKGRNDTHAGPLAPGAEEGMEPDDLRCSRNARPQKDGEPAARCHSCSQSPHDEAVVARCTQ